MNATVTADGGAPLLPWTLSAEEDRRFRRILGYVVLLFLLLGMLFPWLPVLQPEPDEVVDTPRPVASVLLEPREQEPAPAPAPAPETAQTEAPATEPRPEEPEARAPAPSEAPAEPSARERAERSGVLALRDRLDQMRRQAPTDSLRGGELSEDGAEARESERTLTAAATEEGSGGIDSSEISRESAGTELAGRGTSEVESPVGVEGGSGRAGRTRDHRGMRTDEEIQLVFDRNKQGIYALYNRALRQDPTLRGQVVLRLTIAPSGEVTAARIVSSELEDDELERRLLTRIRQLDFGAKDVETISINYPIDFFPS